MADQRLTDKDFISSIEDTDLVHVVDVSDTTANADGTSKKGLWSLIKSTLKTYFDSFYQPTPALQPNEVLNGDYFNTTGYEYFVWADLYRINNVLYNTFISDTLTLTAADPTNDRFDIIVINNNGTFSVIEGTAAANPEVPTLSIDTDTQVELVTIRVTANTTSPDGITTRLVYDENAQEAGGEWDTASTGASVILNSAEQAESGTVSIKYNNASNNDAAEFSYSSAFNGSDLSSIKFNIYLPTSDNYRFYVIFALGGVSLSRILVEDGLFGFNSSTTASWQTIIIPSSAITDITTGTYDEIGFVNNRNNVTFFIDNVNIQEGAAPVGGNNGTVTSVGISGSDGIEVDSGSPITTSGTIALGIDRATLKSTNFPPESDESVTGTDTLDHTNIFFGLKTMTGDTTFSDSNLVVDGFARGMILKGDFTPSFPAYWLPDINSETYDGGATAEYRLTWEVLNATASSEDVRYRIEKIKA